MRPTHSITIWVCRVLHLAFIKGDETDGARVGLPAFCAKELHQDCGWLAAYDPAGDTPPPDPRRAEHRDGTLAK